MFFNLSISPLDQLLCSGGAKAKRRRETAGQAGLRMPLFFRKRKPSEDSQKRLEHQLCRVRTVCHSLENPTFDWGVNGKLPCFYVALLTVHIGTRSALQHTPAHSRTQVVSTHKYTQQCQAVSSSRTTDKLLYLLLAVTEYRVTEIGFLSSWTESREINKFHPSIFVSCKQECLIRTLWCIPPKLQKGGQMCPCLQAVLNARQDVATLTTVVTNRSLK